MLPALQLVQPTTVEEASRALVDFGEKAKCYAGGAELLLLLRNRLLDAEILVDMKKIERLHRVEMDGNILRAGACVTHQTLSRHKLVLAHAPALAYAESQVANMRVRNQGTLGGNLAFNDPHSDPGTVLLIHDATVTIGNGKGERRIGLDRFFVDMYATALETGDLLLEVEIPRLPEGMTSAYIRLHRYQRPTLGVAAAARMGNGVLSNVRLAVGCIGPKPLRLTELEKKVNGLTVDDAKKIVAQQTEYLRELFQPVDDLLGSADYKVYMAGVMLGEALEQVGRK
jgi:aerobic carbon-monoxide dehydrogenase medium subunit